MPEYLSPGVYVEETSFRSKSIEGVSTSTAGFVGPTRWGLVCGEPELITSQADFELYYGSLDDLVFTDQPEATPNFSAHGVRAFFEEGGQRLYVTRAYNFGKNPATGERLFAYRPVSDSDDTPADCYGVANISDKLSLVARFPGAVGNMRVTIAMRAGANALLTSPEPGNPKNRIPVGLSQVQSLSLVYVSQQSTTSGTGASFASSSAVSSASSAGVAPANGLYLTYWNIKAANPSWQLISLNGTTLTYHSLDEFQAANAQFRILPINMLVEVQYPTITSQGTPGFGEAQLLGEFGFDPRVPGSLTSTFVRNPTNRFQALTIPFVIEPKSDLKGLLPTPDMVKEDDRNQAYDKYTLAFASELLNAPSTAAPVVPQGASSAASFSSPPGGNPPTLLDALENGVTTLAALRAQFRLAGGNDGALPDLTSYQGEPTQFKDFLNDPIQSPKNGLLAFEAVDDISIVAAPGYSANFANNSDEVFAIESAVIDHCTRMRYRVAVLDTPPGQLVSGALDFRNLTSSKYAALYYPWITILNPLTDLRLNLPPSGFVAGIYARNDTEHAVFKAPANEVVRLAIDFEQRLNKAQQDVLNPQGVNCFRFFLGHGFKLWGARTISDDSEWKYVSVRRYFAYLEHSIDRGTQWVVFENNGPQLWDNVRRTVEDFLFNEWKMGALLGNKPEQAYFVRCDRSTMTQNDLDNGRLVCLIGVAVVKPAEFVIFRIGQWTATTNG